MLENILIIKFKDKIKLNVKFILGNNPYLIVEDNNVIKSIINKYNYLIEYKHLFPLSNNKLMDLYDYTNTNARIEPGAVIRDNVTLADDCIILMGAVVNTKASIGSRTMVDMNAVIGSGAIIMNNCHIGAGVVIAGVLEPISNKPVIIHENVFIGANAVVLEGVTINKNSVIGAGTIVTKDVLENEVVYNKQQLISKEKTEAVEDKTSLNEDLRT
ncbi:MAG: DapH/DapD/GlmU-related protein [bacterium]